MGTDFNWFSVHEKLHLTASWNQEIGNTGTFYLLDPGQRRKPTAEQRYPFGASVVLQTATVQKVRVRPSVREHKRDPLVLREDGGTSLPIRRLRPFHVFSVQSKDSRMEKDSR